MASVLNLSPVYVTACFEYLFEMLRYDAGEGGGEELEDQIMQVCGTPNLYYSMLDSSSSFCLFNYIYCAQVRRRTTATISVLCSSIPRLGSDAALMDKIFNGATAFLQQSGSVLNSQR